MSETELVDQTDHHESGSSESGTTLQPGAARATRGLTPEQLRALPAAFPFDPTVSKAFGISRSAAYRALAAGQLPVTPLKIGRRLIVRRAELLAALRVADPS